MRPLILMSFSSSSSSSWPNQSRLKLKLTVRKEVLHGVTVQERVVVPLVVKWIQCEDCAKVRSGRAGGAFVGV